MTKKLFWPDSHLTRFHARVTDSWFADNQRVLVLDQSAFYPEGGGQPHDTGHINATRVIKVESDDDGRILHYLERDAPFAIGAEVVGEIDWARRREMLQQHTGQHILSQAFFQLFGAETKGFRITDRAAEIDLTLELHADELAQALARAEELANEIVFDDRVIRLHEVTPAEAARLPLRKESFITDTIRVIEIADYDWSPCGGTHAQRTGEVGLIAIKNWERAKGMTRIDFLCGVRALRDYRAANHTAEAIARQFTVGRDEAPAAVARLFDENKRLTRRTRELAATAAQVEAQELLAATTATNGLRIVTRIFTDRDVEEMKLLAHRLVANDGVVALLAVREATMARLVFARAADVPADMNALLRQACERLGGRGGGKPDFAQGGGAKLTELETALTMARAALVAN
jgi:alanyl-tRNA synthetase